MGPLKKKITRLVNVQPSLEHNSPPQKASMTLLKKCSNAVLLLGEVHFQCYITLSYIINYNDVLNPHPAEYPARLRSSQLPCLRPTGREFCFVF